MVHSPQCEICSAEVEDLDHLLRYCPNATGAWQAIQQQGSYSSANDEGLHVWLRQNIIGAHEDLDWLTKFLITVWYIWKWRCVHCFDAMEGVRREKDLFLSIKFKDILNALSQDYQIKGLSITDRSEVGV